jgi:Cu-Zn family superoxide dismutase
LIDAAVSAVAVLGGSSNNRFRPVGYVLFRERDDGNLDVTVSVTGLTDGGHGYHVHVYGDVSSWDAMATGGHFIGNCASCRPDGKLQEAGLLDDGTPLAVTGGAATYTFTETVAKLRGENSIIGRAVVVHGNNASSGARVAQGVIGLASEAASPPFCECGARRVAPHVTRRRPEMCSVLWCAVVCCGVLWCAVVCCGVVWCGVVWTPVVKQSAVYCTYSRATCV